MSSKVKSSEEITAAADELQVKLAALRKEARRMKKLEAQQEAEAKRQNEIAFAIEFVEFAKQVRFREGGETYYDFLSRMIAESKENHADNDTSESDDSRTEERTLDFTESREGYRKDDAAQEALMKFLDDVKQHPTTFNKSHEKWREKMREKRKAIKMAGEDTPQEDTSLGLEIM